MEADGRRVRDQVEGDRQRESFRRSAELDAEALGERAAAFLAAVVEGDAGALADQPVDDRPRTAASADHRGAGAEDVDLLAKRAYGADPIDVVADQPAVVVDDRVHGADRPRLVIDRIQVLDDSQLVRRRHAESANAESPHRYRGAGGVLRAEGDVHIIQAERAIGGVVHGDPEPAGPAGDRAAENRVAARRHSRLPFRVEPTN